MNTFTVPVSDYSKIRKSFARCAEKARRAKLPEPKLSHLRTYHETFAVADGFARLTGNPDATRTVGVELAEFTIDPGDISLLTYQVTGGKYRLKDRDGNVLIRSWGEIPERDEKLEICCEHCGHKRNRAQSYFVTNEDGETLEVGSTCLEEFLGPNSGQKVAGLNSISEILREAEKSSFTSFRNLAASCVEAEAKLVLAVANRIIDENGFISSADARWNGQEPTYREVAHAIQLSITEDAETPLDSHVPYLNDFLAADDILEDLAKRDTDFKRDAFAAAEKGFCGPREVALLTAAVAGYTRQQKLDREHASKRERTASSRHIGQVGDRTERIVEVIGIREFDTRWGTSKFINMIDEQGNVLLWKTAAAPKDLEVGHLYELEGTVQEHGTVDKGPLSGAAMTRLVRVSFGLDLGPRSDPDPAENLSREDEDALLTAFPGEKKF